MLKSAEIEIKKEHQVLMVNKTTSFKKQGKSKGKNKKSGKKAATPPMNGPKPDAECYYCKEKGHWKRNCSKYLADLKSGLVKKKKEEILNTFTIDTAGNTTTKQSEGKIFVAKNGTFLEKEFLIKEVTGRKVELDEIEESLLVDQSSAVPEEVPVPPTPATEEANDNDHETSNEIATEPRRSTRERATPDWYDPCLNVMIVDNNDEDPATYEEAMMSPDSNKWQEAMKSEMGSMYDNKVWTLVDLPDSRKAVENKWIFKRKTDDDGMEHWTTVKNILKYLKRTKDMFLCYGGDQELVVTSYTDASWNTDPDDSKSQSGYVFILNGAAVSGQARKGTVAKSSTSEYIAASEASSEAVWMKRFIVELVVPSALDPLVIYCDNMGAIANAQEPRSHKRLKHIKLRYHLIREYIEDGEVLEGSRKVRKKSLWKAESRRDSTTHGRPTLEGGVQGGLHQRWPATPSQGKTNSWVFHLYNEGQGEGGGHPNTTRWPHPIVAGAPLSQTLAPPLLHLSRTLSEAPPEFSITTATTPSCCRIQGGATTSAAHWNGEKDVIFINTERVTEYGGAARSWHRDQDLLRAFASGK
ncbi:hypothetical protein QYE76_051614 [Lolium multiflorum]|uniref:CCHC-type domain-containing protein n=1 Tax=Lolium multiflorum TaxID=4521 RepID=A0AAD8ST52_LOLMU|nr:hypothetical protein QYE76_051614 [Lolium multiflorum]